MDVANAMLFLASDEADWITGRALVVDGELVGVAGVLLREVIHHARHAWLYDLVVDESRRGEGYGTVEFVEEWADERDCEYLALASPLSKDEVHWYYEGLDYEKRGDVVEKER